MAAANALAAESNETAATAALKLEQLRAQVGPRQSNHEAFLEALQGETAGNVRIVYLRNDPERFDVAQQIWYLLVDTGWLVTLPVTIFDGRQGQLAAMNVDGQPAGLTVVASVQSQPEADAELLRANGQAWVHTPFTTLTYAIERGVGRIRTHINGQPPYARYASSGGGASLSSAYSVARLVDSPLVVFVACVCL